VLAVALNILAEAVAMGGEFGWAERLIAEADAVTEATGTQVLQYGALFLRAWQGREADVSRLSDVTVRDSTAGGQGTAIEFVDHARAVILNGLGRYREAMPPARDAPDAHPRTGRRRVGAYRADDRRSGRLEPTGAADRRTGS